MLVMVIVSVAAYLAAYFIPQGLVTVAVMSLCGYLLSLDWGGIGNQILSVCFPQCSGFQMDGEKHGFMWKWGILEALYHVLMLGVAVTTALIVNLYLATNKSAEDYSDYLGYVIIGLLAIELILADLQSVYVVFGLWRNKLYPPSVQRTTIFRKGKKKLNVLGYIRRFIMDFGRFICISLISTCLSGCELELDVQKNCRDAL